MSICSGAAAITWAAGCTPPTVPVLAIVSVWRLGGFSFPGLVSGLISVLKF